MIVLALDTAGTGCYAALYDSDTDIVLSSAGADIGRGHAERLMAFVDEALAKAGLPLEKVGRIAVTIGPGSFTGIRVGVAAARGFALALSIPAVGISTFSALAGTAREENPGEAVLVAMDAKRDEIYCQSFDASGAPLDEPRIVAVDEARQNLSDFAGVICGSASRLLRDDGPDLSRAGSGDRADIGTVARLGALADPATNRPAPLYLRGPDVRPQAGFAVARA